MIGPRIAITLLGALIGGFLGLLVGLWRTEGGGEGDVLAVADAFWGAVIGVLVGFALGFVASVFCWRSPNG